MLAFIVPADSDAKFDGDIGKLGDLGIGTIRGTSGGVQLDSALKSFLAFNRQRDYSEAIASFDRALTSMKDDHSFEAIYEKYLGPAKPGH